MAKRFVVHPDGSQESWDSDTNVYVKLDETLSVVETRELTIDELYETDPVRAAVDQLVLDSLLGG